MAYQTITPQNTSSGTPDIGGFIKANLPTIGGVVGGIAGTPADILAGPAGTAVGSAGGSALGTILQSLLNGQNPLSNPGNIAKNAASNGLLGLIPGAAEGAGTLEGAGKSAIQKFLESAAPSAGLAGASQGVQDIGSGKSLGDVAKDVGTAGIVGGTINGIATPILDKLKQGIVNAQNVDIPDSLINQVQKNPEKLTADINEEAKTRFASILSAYKPNPQLAPDVLNYAVKNGIYNPTKDITEQEVQNIANKAAVHMQTNISNKFDQLYTGKTADLGESASGGLTPNTADFYEKIMNGKSTPGTNISQLVEQLPYATQKKLDGLLPTADDYIDYTKTQLKKPDSLSSTKLASWPAEDLQKAQYILRTSSKNGQAGAKLSDTIDNELDRTLSDGELQQKQAIKQEYFQTHSVLQNAESMLANKKQFEDYTPDGIKSSVQKAVDASLIGKVDNMKTLVRNWGIPAMLGGYMAAGWPGGLIVRLTDQALNKDLTSKSYMGLGQGTLDLLQNPKAQAIGNGVNGLITQLLARTGQQPSQQQNQNVTNQ